MATPTKVGEEEEEALKRAANHFILNWNKMFDLAT
jgi:hypothetical protein